MSGPRYFSRLPLLGPLFERQPAAAGTHHRVDEVCGYRIHASEYGAGEDCVVLIHGLAGSARWWRQNVDALAARYRVVVPDLIGFGHSPCPDLLLPDAAAVAALLAEWIGGLGRERVHLIGHSMGGQIAIHLAATVPERVDRLVLVDAAGMPRPIGARALVQFLAGIAPLSSWGDPGFVPVIARDAVRAGPITLAQAAVHILRDDVRPLLPRITAPTLVIWGERDRWVPIEHGRELAERIPGATRIVLPRAAHNPMVDRPHEFNRIVMRFLEGLPVT